MTAVVSGVSTCISLSRNPLAGGMAASSGDLKMSGVKPISAPAVAAHP
jgi:hypothetical protein